MPGPRLVRRRAAPHDDWVGIASPERSRLHYHHGVRACSNSSIAGGSFLLTSRISFAQRAITGQALYFCLAVGGYGDNADWLRACRVDQHCGASIAIFDQTEDASTPATT